MIIDLEKFIAAERPCWSELEDIIHRLETKPNLRLTLDELRHFHHLYERTSADLGKIMTFSSEPEVCRYLESLVARAYGEIHETRRRQHHFSALQWFFHTLPQTFRRHIAAFWLSLGITVAGGIFCGVPLAFYSGGKPPLMPAKFFKHLCGSS